MAASDKHANQQTNPVNAQRPPELLISSFDTLLWNTISSKKLNTYKVAWNDPQRTNIVHPQFSNKKK
jgi:hypothetical protein